MADDQAPNDAPDNQGDGNNSQKKDPKTILGFAVIVVILIFSQFQSCSGDNPATPSQGGGQATSNEGGAEGGTGGPGGDGPDQGGQQQDGTPQSSRTENEDGGTSFGAGDDFGVTGPSRQAAVVALEKRVAENTRQQEAIRSRIEDLADSQEEFEEQILNRIDQRLSSITDQVKAMEDREAENLRSGGQSQAPADDLPQPIPDEGESSESSGSAPSPVRPPRGQGSSQGSSDVSAYMRQQRERARRQRQSSSRGPSPGSDSEENVFYHVFDPSEKRLGDANQSPDETEEEEQGDQWERYTYTVPLSASTHGINKNGLVCPIGSDVSGDNGGILSSLPVFIPIEGTFKGPEGSRFDVGKAHLVGRCFGVDTTERAMVKIERMSYIDNRGEPQTANVNGVIYDQRDNQPGLAGTKVSKKSEQIGLGMVAQTLSSVADGISASQFERQTSDGGDSASEVMTGELGKAAVGQGLGDGISRLSDYLFSKAEASFEVITVPGGPEVYFETTSPIQLTEYREAD